MFERTITIGSAGKTWSVTGWKQGWMIGNAQLVRAAQRLWNNSGSSGQTPIQEALNRAFCVEMDKDSTIHATVNEESYFQQLPNDQLRPKRAQMADIVRSMGLQPIMPDAGYFMMANASSIKQKMATVEGEDSDRPWDVQCKFFSFYSVSYFSDSLSVDDKSTQVDGNSRFCILPQGQFNRSLCAFLFC